MIKIDNLKKQFGETCACDIPSFTINDGDILGLVGNNGAGKTTLFRLLLDLLKADEGSVSYVFSLPDGEPSGTVATEGTVAINPTESEAWKQHVGAYIDEGFLIDFLTPEEYFAFLGKVSGISQQEVDARLQQFERFANGEVFGQKKLIRNLSAGNKMKVGIISALFRRPKTVILDEPFNFLDPTSQMVLKHLLQDYANETGSTILISSHNLQHTVDISTRIALLEHGKIIRDLSNNEGSAASELQEYFEAE
ncbi:MAG: ABC transporter ATP-binding protein [Prevotella sp.]|jgi:ABC-2 type transport system ATP-binding protein|nr:ABC transporter ATP-binding protein [Prevotella sp.]